MNIFISTGQRLLALLFMLFTDWIVPCLLKWFDDWCLQNSQGLMKMLTDSFKSPHVLHIENGIFTVYSMIRKLGVR